MPFFLAFPPTEHVSQNSEVSQTRAADTKSFRESLKKTLGAQLKPLSVVSKGAFRGTEVVAWNGKFNGIIYTAFLYPFGKKQDVEWMRVSALLRQTDCVLMGSTWEWRGEAPKDVPRNLLKGGSPLSASSERNFDSANPYRFEATVAGPFGQRSERLFEIVGGEALASAKIPAVSSLGRGWCDAIISPEMKPSNGTTYPARAHRLLVGQWEEKKADGKKTWPDIRGSFALNSGTFGERKQTVFEKKEFENFSPVTISDELLKKLAPVTHKITDEQFTVIKRQGRWVYLDRGKAFGLDIGIHLVARGATLHVVQYAPEEKEFDVAVAQIRSENPAAPLKVGDKISFDLTKLPKK